MDWYSRKVLSWDVSTRIDESFCVSALERALRLYPKPEIFNSDLGSLFTSKSFTNVLKDVDIRISMDGKGRCIDNIFIELLWRRQSSSSGSVCLNGGQQGTQKQYLKKIKLLSRQWGSL